MSTQDDQKRMAAEAAVAEVEDGMVLGLGTGSTAALAITALGVRVKSGLRVIGVPTSEASAAQVRALGIQLATLDEQPRIDLTIDGADEVQTDTLDLIKGLGGALLREKIVATASRRMTVVADDSKLVPVLGARVKLPVEIVAFGARATLDRLTEAGVHPTLRRKADGQEFITDGGNLIADCQIGPRQDAASLQAVLKSLVGVVETGLFIGIATRVIVGTPSGPRILTRNG